MFSNKLNKSKKVSFAFLALLFAFYKRDIYLKKNKKWVFRESPPLPRALELSELANIGLSMEEAEVGQEGFEAGRTECTWLREIAGAFIAAESTSNQR